MTLLDLEGIRRRWEVDRPLYVDFANYVKRAIEDEAQRRHLPCRVDARAKDLASLIKKLLRKQYESPYERVTDKAGARVIVYSLDHLATAQSIIEHLFHTEDWEDKGDGLGIKEFGYRGIHFEARLRDDRLVDGLERFGGLRCEIQLATLAQRVWADVEHSLVYKAEQVPREVRRAFSRLAALMEIFDTEVERARAMILNQPGYEEAALLAQIEPQFFSLTAAHYDRELSLMVLGTLKDALTKEQIASFDREISAFVANNREKLVQIFDEYAGVERSPLMLFQPESIFVFSRLNVDPYTLRDLWEQVLPGPMLDDLISTWGDSL